VKKYITLRVLSASSAAGGETISGEEVYEMINYTAKYTKIESGYMGQLVEWPEIVTEGKDLEECRKMLRDALKEMVLAYQEIEREIPAGNALIEQLPVEVERVC
jgi:predicted RNase H-like HicB family nuclease